MTWIDVRIPYAPDKNLAHAYNWTMENSLAQWVLLLDQDVFLCNPDWYNICLETTERLKSTNAGLITCVTNGVHSANETPQKADIIEKSDRINTHIKVAQTLHDRYGNEFRKIDWEHITGFFMLVNKRVWQEVEFRQLTEGDLNKIDWDFSTRLLEHGFEIYLLPGLYVYHRRGLRKIRNA